MSGQKLFRDPIHGYISIPVEYCEKFIDNKIFQRLRRIEQTSMRVLYPSAHHDRFSHSLGVFHLGQTAVNYLCENSPILKDYPTAINSFLIACLLHDCAHSSFSHTFEKYYILNRSEEIRERLVKCVTDGNFKEDFSNSSPAPHELVSAIVAIETFREGIIEIEGDPNLVARMIIGCTFLEDRSKGIENCLINLLNGLAIDVDKLDYIIRDTWVSGVNNVKIDDRRLLSSLLIEKDRDGIYKILFKKHAINVISNVVAGRNFLYEWVYSHHKVVYEQYLIVTALAELSRIKSEKDEFLKHLFSIDTLYQECIFNGYHFYLPSDGDIIYLLKQHEKEIPEVVELLSRSYQNKALWKTKAEFNHVLDGINEKRRLRIFRESPKILKEYFLQQGITGESVVKKIESKLITIQKDEIFIDLDGDQVSFTDLFPEIDKVAGIYFIPYVPKEAYKNLRNEIIKELRRQL